MNDKGGVLGRKVALVVYDDGSDPATAIRLYEKLITQDKVDLVLGPFGNPITDAVADVTEKHKWPMVVSSASVTSIYRLTTTHKRDRGSRAVALPGDELSKPAALHHRLEA